MNKCLTCRTNLNEGSECEYCEARRQFVWDFLASKLDRLERRVTALESTKEIQSDLDGCF